MSVVTVSREHGSGGRKLGELLAKELGFLYVDKMIAHELAEKTDLNEDYIDRFLDTGVPMGMQSSPKNTNAAYSADETQRNINLQIETHKFLKDLASSKDVVIVGRASDIILSDFNPFRLFVYSDVFDRVTNCREDVTEYNMKGVSDKDIQRNINLIDAERHQHHALFSPIAWGDKFGYDLCINTSNINLEKIVPAIAAYARIFFETA